ncbi:MAG: hypothetical protein ACRDJ9_20570, partial [Dehalococcoidia bacterium]
MVDAQSAAPAPALPSHAGNGAAPATDQPAIATPSPALPLQPVQPVLPIPPIQLKRAVSGRYRSAGAGYQLELRVDVDGHRPVMRVSGDFYRVSGATTTYFGSFIVDAPSVSATPTTATITGTITATWSTSHRQVRVTVPRTTILQPAAGATVQFFTTTGGAGATYVCPFQSRAFRTVQFEQDFVTGVTPFSSYDTGLLPSGGPARTLSVVAAYAEAGIETQTAGVANQVSLGGIGSSWSDAELHASMVTQFSLWRDEPQWKVWLLAANLHDLGTGLRGIMFDQQGKQRQGCAVFHDAIGGTTPEIVRAQLRTYVHELGHCFNLLHSWQKSFAVPPAPNRPAALSWMNYVQNFPGGAPAYWAAFPFQFDDPEIVHLRHGFRNNVIPGGNNFAIGAALMDPEAFATPVADDSGLRLELETRGSYAYGEPVVTEIKLYTDDMRGKRVRPYLHPNMGFVQIGIRGPSGRVSLYRPVIEHCMDAETTLLDATHPSIYASAYIGYGKDGFYFDEPGIYQLRAIYHAPDGSEVTSNVCSLRVRTPLSAADDDMAGLLLGDDQGMLFYLLGSDSVFLRAGNEALDTALEKHAKHPLAVYARLAKGINAAREFKTVTPDKALDVRPPKPQESAALLDAVVDASAAGKGVDNITLNMTMRRLAAAEHAAGNDKAATATMNRMGEIFEKKQLRPHVMETIRLQADAVIA